MNITYANFNVFSVPDSNIKNNDLIFFMTNIFLLLDLLKR